jgi:hypothetical protein
MPSANAILDSAASIANGWWTLATAWHALFGLLVVGLIAGWRPSHRVAGYLLAAPFMSVSVLAWSVGNPFNGSAFAALALSLMLVASRLPTSNVQLGPRTQVAAGAALLAFGWTYPHFVTVSHWTGYLYAAPLGLLPCPTLAAVIGVTLSLCGLRSRGWSVALVAAGFVYGVVGVFALGVALDYALLGGAIVLGAVALPSPVRSWRLDRPRAIAPPARR